MNGLLPTAQAENNAVTASNDAESSSKWLNEVLIENALSGSSFSLSQLTDLRVLAAKCPYNEGQAVYHARTILSQLEDVEYYNSCEGTIPESQRVSQQISEVKAKSDFQLYPNPNAGEMNLHYSLDEKEQGTFSIYDVSGKLITTYNLKAGNDQLLFISESHLNNGMYFYKVIINGELRLNDKIVIIK